MGFGLYVQKRLLNNELISIVICISIEHLPKKLLREKKACSCKPVKIKHTIVNKLAHFE